MSLRPTAPGPIPAETIRVAQAAFPKGNRYLQLRDALGPLFADVDFAALFSPRGRPAEAPWRLALVTVWQFAEGLPDRQAADAVRARLDWKYALGLELTDAGFDFSVLSEFRARLIAGAAEQQLLDALLAVCKAQGYVKSGGRQRTDATHVLGAVRLLSRLERVGETLRAALNALAAAAPTWLAAHSAPDWGERYGHRVEEYRLPKSKEARAAYGVQVGEDGLAVLAAVAAADAALGLAALPAVETLRQLWIQQYAVLDGVVRLREPKDMPPSADQLPSPYETEARFATKRDTSWVGYKVHVTESCDETPPHLITQVTTTAAPEVDVTQLAAIQQGLQAVDLLPAQQLVDTGYISGHTIVQSQERHHIELVGPMYVDTQWQARAGEGFDLAHFRLDWAGRVATCPQGQQSVRWQSGGRGRGGSLIQVQFAAAACTPCPVRSRCTQAPSRPRQLSLRPQAEQAAIQASRERQQQEGFRVLYAHRAGIEGTLSQGVRAFGLRQARYRGQAKTHLQHVATAVAINLNRLAAFLAGVPVERSRTSRFAALAAGQ